VSAGYYCTLGTLYEHSCTDTFTQLHMHNRYTLSSSRQVIIQWPNVCHGRPLSLDIQRPDPLGQNGYTHTHTHTHSEFSRNGKDSMQPEMDDLETVLINTFSLSTHTHGLTR